MDAGDLKKLLLKLGEDLGVPDLDFDERSVCELAIGDDASVAIKAEPEDNLLILSSPLAADLPDPLSYSLALDIADLALGPCIDIRAGGPVIGRDSVTGIVVLYQICTASRLRQESIFEIFSNFVNLRFAAAAKLARNEGFDSGAEISDLPQDDKSLLV